MSKRPSLPDELTIYRVGELRSQWLAWLDKMPAARTHARNREWLVDGSNVAEIDAAGMQLLLALKNSLWKKNRVLRVANASLSLVGACDALGLSDLMDAQDRDERK